MVACDLFLVSLYSRVKLDYLFIAVFDLFGDVFVTLGLGYHVFLDSLLVVYVNTGNFLQLLLFLG